MTAFGLHPIDWLTIYYNRLMAEAKAGDKLMIWYDADATYLYLNGAQRYKVNQRTPEMDVRMVFLDVEERSKR